MTRRVHHKTTSSDYQLQEALARGSILLQLQTPHHASLICSQTKVYLLRACATNDAAMSMEASAVQMEAVRHLAHGARDAQDMMA